jgi:predicted PurR-regulated permease PerM
MLEPVTSSATPQLRRILLGFALGALAVLCLLILRPVLAPIVWAAILAYASWPLYRRLRAPLRAFNTSAALLMTLLMTCAVVVPLVWLLVLLQNELAGAYGTLTAFLARGPRSLPSAIRDIPWLGTLIQEGLDRYTSDPSALGREVVEWLKRSLTLLTGVLGDIGRNLAKLLLAMLTLFFVYRDGDTVVQQGRRVTQRFLGDRVTP